jgi:hypothetical protein
VKYLDGDLPLPEQSNTHMSFSLLSLMQDEEFDPYVVIRFIEDKHWYNIRHLGRKMIYIHGV